VDSKPSASGVLTRARSGIDRLLRRRRRPAPAPQSPSPTGKKARLRSGTIDIQKTARARDDASELAADDGLKTLANALEHPDAEVRARAIGVVSTLSDGRVTRLLRASMVDPCPTVRCAASRAAGHAKSLELVASLLVALADPDPDVRSAAAEAVSQTTGWPVVPIAADATIDASAIRELKRWWKDRRREELAASELA
jgi:HEAT repeats